MERRRNRRAGAVLAACTVLSALAAGAQDTATNAEPQPSFPAGLASGGQACFHCHGPRGEGDAAGAVPRLAGQGAWYLYASLRDYAAGHRPNPVMTPVARSLSDEQMEQLAAHYAGLRGVPHPPAPPADADRLRRGRALAEFGDDARGIPACNSCHGVDGAGTAAAPYLAGQHASYLALQLQLWRSGRRGGDPLDVMAQIARHLAPDDIEAAALHYASLRDVEPLAGEASPSAGADFRPPPETREAAPVLGVAPSR